jgi:hypothetical protein
MERIQNWRGEKIGVARSKGGTLVVINPFDNLVRGDISLWPPPEIVQKLYKSRQVRAFEGLTRKEVTQVLGYYSDLQSLHSEDAITWSVFGILAHADQEARCSYVGSLMNLMGIPSPPITEANIWLWRRVPHPETLVSGGPEIDFGIQTDNTVIFGEAKWLSPIGAAQGKNRDKTQITLRNEFFEKYGELIWGDVKRYILLGLSLLGGMVENKEINLGHASLYQRDMTWAAACGINEHPLKDELEKYLKWKKEHSKPGR